MLEDIFVCIMFASIGIIAVIINVICIVKLFKMMEMQNIFGYICLTHCIANFSVSIIYVLWVPLIILILPKNDFIYYFNTKIGQLGMFWWYLSIYCHVLVCINRFIAIYLPLKYNTFFNDLRTKIFICALWIIAFIHIIPYFFPTCDYYFDAELYLFSFSDSNCSHILGNIIDFRLTTIYVIITIFIDFLICIKLVYRFKKILNSTEIKTINKKTTLFRFNFNKSICKYGNPRKVIHKSQGRDTVTTGGTKYKPTMKTKFFIQAFCQNFIFLIEILSFYVFSTYFTTKLSVMAFTSCAWELCHMLDGLCLMIFNKEIRKTVIRCKFCYK
ncbi:GPCR, rhodopsin-like, 7TM domain and 7TM GPCR, serpentine receptor class x (Srx) family-containing protein [Strongyloides ratti]|uniref:GPCR, rhodopsin-like, 7TM domain and 7TM GPCR, serpentine receptor class x (Srx) family-containing protein n=1 Tax=Strongyloides ratti TaxID=34506 RepID=A0A090L875_STRRB|nr:GPCR, rhodopsin-like, 7TM domain and 7TM GPCR, serpentine receptor class x (Srx) family-containing protein [Strongyloides ratti]CEF64313.1 GPCR, rhodopsin-like, 7TM domain and 7TM GPCR, serpentine receptor class x (Srx) family-containing protein [Strongyloides ratti]